MKKEEMFVKLGNIVLFLPGFIAGIASKTLRFNLDDMCKQEILKNGLYHITPNEEVSKKIVESQHFKPARGLFKNFNSYGKACVCFFDGAPTIDNYLKNLSEGENTNPYVNPNIVTTAVKVSPKSKEELVNYKSRALNDNAILFEGYCVLPKDEIKSVYLVPDLVRDSKTGEPILNPETGRYDISFREALEEELSQDKHTYKPKEDYLKFMEEESKRLGYVKDNVFTHKQLNFLVNVKDVALIETNFFRNNLFSNIVKSLGIEGKVTPKKFFESIPKAIKAKFIQITSPKLDMSIDERITRETAEFNTKNKNPYRDRKFGETIAEFQTQGLEQLKLKEELKNLTTSDIGKYFRQKYNQIDKNNSIKNGINGINHNNRVAIFSMIIAEKEGILETDNNNNLKDILLSAAYYHDIGRKKGITRDNYGFNAKNSVKMIEKMDLTYLNGQKYSENDKKILKAIVEAQESKDKNMLKICEKYKIDAKDFEKTVQLMKIIKDADALDRVRLDLNIPTAMKTNLNPKLLRLNTSKQLLNAAYQLEKLTQKVSFDRILAYKTEEQKEGGEITTKREVFVDYLRQGISQTPNMIKKAKRAIQLSKKNILTKFKGKNIINQLKQKKLNKTNSDKNEQYER